MTSTYWRLGASLNELVEAMMVLAFLTTWVTRTSQSPICMGSPRVCVTPTPSPVSSPLSSP